MSQVGFYGWIREGVKRAVLLGVSDAVEQLGVPDDSTEVGSHLLAVLRSGDTARVAVEDKRKPAPATERKRLGRSLDQIVQNSKRDDEE